VEFLRYIITTTGVEMSNQKIQAVLEWLTPTNIKEVQSFLGFANYYRKFIKRFGSEAKPLTNLTRKDQEFKWTKEAQEAFEMLKKKFTEKPILVSFDLEKEILIETDTSDHSISTCISQEGK